MLYQRKYAVIYQTLGFSPNSLGFDHRVFRVELKADKLTLGQVFYCQLLLYQGSIFICLRIYSFVTLYIFIYLFICLFMTQVIHNGLSR